MLNFWIIAALMVTVMLLVILVPLIRQTREGVSNEAKNDKASTAKGYKSIAVVALIMPVAAIGIYLMLDEQQVYDSNLAAQNISSGTGNGIRPVSDGKSLPPVEIMLQQLKERLQREPGDAKGWNLLGKSYEYMGKQEAAKEAFARAAELGFETTVAVSSGPVQVNGSVALDPSLQGKVSPTDTVFIFARAVSGPRMPLAAIRRQVKDLPLEFVLDDSMAMSPATKLSQFNRVIIGARISSSGNAKASEGDFEGFSGVVHVGTSGQVAITVGQAVINSPGQGAGG